MWTEQFKEEQDARPTGWFMGRERGRSAKAASEALRCDPHHWKAVGGRRGMPGIRPERRVARLLRCGPAIRMIEFALWIPRFSTT